MDIRKKNLNNHQRPTRGHKTLGLKSLFEHSASHQILVSGDRDAAPKSPTILYSRPLYAILKLHGI
jgi:hypothetical protein